MSLSLDKIISNPELANTVSVEWIQQELQKQPYNRFLQGLLEQRTLPGANNTFTNHENLIESIISDSTQRSLSSFYIRDVILLTGPTFAEARESQSKESSLNPAAIGTGAIMAGSILSGAKKAVEPRLEKHEEPMSNSEQIAESGLLGFLNRLDGTIPKKKSSPAVDPMLKQENYEKEASEASDALASEAPDVLDSEASDVLDLTDENLEELELEDGNEVPEQIPTLEEKNKPEDEENEDYPDQLIFTDNIAEKKKKKKKQKKDSMPKPQYRWSSETAADYTMTGLDPFTDWINTVDGVEYISVEKSKKKKKKKQKKQFKSLESKPEIASEPLAELLINQGHYSDAIDMYKQLSLKNPEKSSFFAAKIETIKDKI